jgi:hypothetical protein
MQRRGGIGPPWERSGDSTVGRDRHDGDEEWMLSAKGGAPERLLRSQFISEYESYFVKIVTSVSFVND